MTTEEPRCMRIPTVAVLIRLQSFFSRFVFIRMQTAENMRKPIRMHTNNDIIIMNFVEKIPRADSTTDYLILQRRSSTSGKKHNITG